VGPRPEWAQKIMPLLGLKPIESHYTNYALLAHKQCKYNESNMKVFTSVIKITAPERRYMIAH
jgi:hypothetical protein